MIYEKPGGGKRGLPRQANRELAVALVLFACAAAMAVTYGLGSYCDGRSGWPCLSWHSSAPEDGTTAPHQLQGAQGSGASGILPPVASTPTTTGFRAPTLETPSVLETPTVEIVRTSTPGLPPTRSIPTARPLPATLVPLSTPTFAVVTLPPLQTGTPSATRTASATNDGQTGTTTPDGTDGTPTATPSATPTDAAYP